MLAVAREHRVRVAQRSDGADLRRLLAPAHQPQVQLALPLERERLVVEAAGEHHVGVQLAGEVKVDLDALGGREVTVLVENLEGDGHARVALTRAQDGGARRAGHVGVARGRLGIGQRHRMLLSGRVRRVPAQGEKRAGYGRKPWPGTKARNGRQGRSCQAVRAARAASSRRWTIRRAASRGVIS
jgi:hypothetical protein